MRWIASVLLLFFVSGSLSYGQTSPLVTKIEIQGVKRIEEGAVKAKISQKIGEPVSQDKINTDIKTIFKMGYFDDVRVTIDSFEGGMKVVYLVKEKPVIVKMDFQGNKELDDAKLKEKVTINPGSIADTVLIQDNAAKLKAFYEEEGYTLANVVPVTRKITDDEIALTFQIDEGSKVKIKKIIVEGNKNISASKIKKAMDTKEWWLFSFITSSGYYKKDQMERDVEKVKNLYFEEGYIKAVVAEPEVAIDKSSGGMTITMRVSEGDRYTVSGLDFSGNKTYDDATIRKLVTIKQGTVFRKSSIEKDIQAITSLYTDNGYALTTVAPDLIPDEKEKTVKITLAISEGDKYRVGRIEVSGNTKTRDKVIRREIRLAEGEIFSGSKLKRSYERINNLNFFETIDMVPKPRYEEKVVDMEVKVKERPTGFFSIGGGYSSIDRFIGTVDLTQGNLFGKGQYAKIKAELGGKSSLYELSFRDPWFLDRPIAFSSGVYKSTRDYIEYDKEAFGFFVGLGKDLSEYWRADVSYNFERATINVDQSRGECLAACPPGDQACRDACGALKDISLIVTDQRGTSTTSSITPSITRDSRDNYLDPSRGSRNSLSVTFAGLGGSNAFIKGSADSAWYFPIGSTTVSARGRFGYAKALFNKKLPLYERFYVGGIYSIRGIGFGEAGPKDPGTGEAIGGTTELIFNTEYIFPILTEMRLKGLFFFDAGGAYEDFKEFGTLRYTAGTGVRWISPMGPIRIEWGYNLKRKPGESSNKFEFAFGSFF